MAASEKAIATSEKPCRIGVWLIVLFELQWQPEFRQRQREMSAAIFPIRKSRGAFRLWQREIENSFREPMALWR
jgi:hypothetical protein